VFTNGDKQTCIKMLWGFLCLFRIEQCLLKWLCFNSKKASNTVSDCQICKCSLSTKIRRGKLGRISKENLSQTSNHEGSCVTSLALMCASVTIIINRLSHLSDCVFNSCWRRKVRNLFQLFHLGIELNKRKERSECFRFKQQLASSVSLSQRRHANRKVF
jgi:hypothetical protein